MTFAVPAFEAQRDALLRDMRSVRPAADVSPDSDWFLRATALASALQGLSQHQLWIARQALPDVCDTDWLERHASLRGLSRKAASAASGAVTFLGTAGAAIPASTEARSAAGVAYVTTAAAVVGSGGSVTVTAQASTTGAATNAVAGAVLTLSAPPAGVQGSATAGAITGGADVEDDEGLRARLLDRIRRPPAGGAAHDYEAWALEVPGVAAAWVHPLRRGDGTVDVTILAAGGMPSPALVDAAQAYIDGVRPVAADCQVLAPVAVPVDVSGTLGLSGTTLAAASAAATATLAEYIASLQPGDTVIRNRIIAALVDVPGVVDVTLTSPAANVATTVTSAAVQLATLGTVALS